MTRILLLVIACAVSRSYANNPNVKVSCWGQNAIDTPAPKIAGTQRYCEYAGVTCIINRLLPSSRGICSPLDWSDDRRNCKLAFKGTGRVICDTNEDGTCSDVVDCTEKGASAVLKAFISRDANG